MALVKIVSAWLVAGFLVLGATAASPHSAPAPGPGCEAEALLALDRDPEGSPAQGDGLERIAASFAPDVRLFAVPIPGFAEGADNARDTLARAIGAPTGITTREPLRAGIAADGRHAFTYGYMTTRIAGAEPRLAKYVAFWLRENGRWQIVLFKRVPRAPGDVSGPPQAPLVPKAFRPDRVRADIRAASSASLAAREAAFSDYANQHGLGPAFRLFGYKEAANTGAGARFTIGPDAIAAELGEGVPPFTWAADRGVIVADSGDLGVTWGMLRRKEPVPPGRLREIPFFTVWYRPAPDGPWLYIAE